MINKAKEQYEIRVKHYFDDGSYKIIVIGVFNDKSLDKAYRLMDKIDDECSMYYVVYSKVGYQEALCSYKKRGE